MKDAGTLQSVIQDVPAKIIELSGRQVKLQVAFL
jgi:hypothetical protein